MTVFRYFKEVLSCKEILPVGGFAPESFCFKTGVLYRMPQNLSCISNN